MVSAARTKDPTLSDPADHQAIHEVTVVTVIERIAVAIEALTAEIRRLARTGSSSVAIDANRTYSRAEVADLLNVSTRTVDRRVRDGALQAVETGNMVRIEGASLHRHRTGEKLVGTRRVLKL